MVSQKLTDHKRSGKTHFSMNSEIRFDCFDKLFFNEQLVLFMVALCANWLAMVVLRLPLQNNGCTSCELVGNGCASHTIGWIWLHFVRIGYTMVATSF